MNKVFWILAIALISSSAFALEGKIGSGGGDAYVLDFIRTAGQEIYPWLIKNGNTLNPNVDPIKFLMAVNAEKISSEDHVFESCDGSNRGREVEACYNAAQDRTYISRSRYPMSGNAIPKIGVVAHEVFRRMGIEGDQYEVSKQIPMLEQSVINSKIMLKWTEKKNVDDQGGWAPFVCDFRADFWRPDEAEKNWTAIAYDKLYVRTDTQDYRGITIDPTLMRDGDVITVQGYCLTGTLAGTNPHTTMEISLVLEGSTGKLNNRYANPFRYAVEHEHNFIKFDVQKKGDELVVSNYRQF